MVQAFPISRDGEESLEYFSKPSPVRLHVTAIAITSVVAASGIAANFLDPLSAVGLFGSRRFEYSKDSSYTRFSAVSVGCIDHPLTPVTLGIFCLPLVMVLVYSIIAFFKYRPDRRYSRTSMKSIWKSDGASNSYSSLREVSYSVAVDSISVNQLCSMGFWYLPILTVLVFSIVLDCIQHRPSYATILTSNILAVTFCNLHGFWNWFCLCPNILGCLRRRVNFQWNDLESQQTRRRFPESSEYRTSMERQIQVRLSQQRPILLMMAQRTLKDLEDEKILTTSNKQQGRLWKLLPFRSRSRSRDEFMRNGDLESSKVPEDSMRIPTLSFQELGITPEKVVNELQTHHSTIEIAGFIQNKSVFREHVVKILSEMIHAAYRSKSGRNSGNSMKSVGMTEPVAPVANERRLISPRSVTDSLAQPSPAISNAVSSGTSPQGFQQSILPVSEAHPSGGAVPNLGYGYGAVATSSYVVKAAELDPDCWIHVDSDLESPAR